MPWFKVDDGFHSHAKAITAGTAALGLWVRCGSWSAHHLTDGFVPANVAREFGSSAQIKALLTSGLWRPVDGGFMFNDFTDYNPTSEAVRTARDDAKERQRRAREAAKARRDAARSSAEVTALSQCDNGVSHAPVTDVSQSPRPDPTRPEGSKEPSTQEPPRIDVEQLCVCLADWIEHNGSKRPTITAGWRDSARLLIDRDGKTLTEAMRLVDWCQRNDFWRANILSMPKFRDKYDQMRLQAQSQAQPQRQKMIGAFER